MATLHFPPGLRQYTGGAESAEVKAGQLRHVLREVTQTYPELEPILAKGTAVSIDGIMVQTPLLQKVASNSEVHLVPQLGGG